MKKLDRVIDVVYDTIKEAERYGLTSEVIATAMIALKENPGLTIEEALQEGLDEWDI